MHWTIESKGLRTVRCRDCGLVYQSDPSQSIAKLYGPAYHNFMDTPQAAESKRDTCSALLRKVPCPSENARFLDIGCGLGYSLEVANVMGYEAWGVEFSAALEERLKTRWGERVRIGDFMEINLPVGSYDTILLMDSIEHFLDPLEVLKRCRASLRPGGWLILATPNFDSWVRRILGKRWEQFKAEHIFYFTFKNLSRALERLGFCVTYGGLFWKKLPIGYFLETVRRFDPWLVPHRLIGFLKRLPTVWKFKLWLPTDGFVLLARKRKNETESSK